MVWWLVWVCSRVNASPMRACCVGTVCARRSRKDHLGKARATTSRESAWRISRVYAYKTLRSITAYNKNRPCCARRACTLQDRTRFCCLWVTCRAQAFYIARWVCAPNPLYRFTWNLDISVCLHSYGKSGNAHMPFASVNEGSPVGCLQPTGLLATVALHRTMLLLHPPSSCKSSTAHYRISNLDLTS